MHWREHAMMAAIGAASSLFMIAIYSLMMGLGVTAGEWLQFSAVFLGVAATISGTLWLQGYTDRRRAQTRTANLVKSLETPRGFLLSIAEEPTANGSGRIEAIDRAFMYVRWARDQLDAPSYHTHAIIETLIEMWENEKVELAENIRTAGFYRHQPAPNVTEKAMYLVDWIDKTLQMVTSVENAPPTLGSK